MRAWLPGYAGSESRLSEPGHAERLHDGELRVLLLLLTVSLIVRAEFLVTRNLWIDEALSLALAEEAPLEILRASTVREPHPPGFYLLLRAWRGLVGPSPEAARWLSMPFGIGSVIVAWSLARGLGGSGAGLLTAALVGLNPFQVFASTEVRMYALVGFVALLSTVLLVHMPNGRLFLSAAYGLTAAILSYLSYYTFPLLLAHSIWLLGALRSSEQRRQLMFAAGVFLVCYAPWVPFLYSSIKSNPVPWRPGMSAKYVAEMIGALSFGGHLWGTSGYLRWVDDVPGWRPVALAIPFMYFGWIGWRWGKDRRMMALLGLSWSVPLLSAFAASLAAGRVAAYSYHLSYIHPYLAALVGIGVTAVAKRFGPGCGRAWVWVCACMLSGMVAAGTYNAVRSPTYRAFRFDIVARVLQAERRSGDVLLFLNSSGFEVLRRYIEPGGLEPYIVIHPDARNWSREAVSESFERALSVLRGEHRRVFAVITHPVPAGSAEDLVSALERKGYGVRGTMELVGVVLVGVTRTSAVGER